MSRQCLPNLRPWLRPPSPASIGLNRIKTRRRIILCSGNGGALVRYAKDNLPNKVLVREYLTALPDEKRLATEIDAVREKLERHE